MIEIHHSQHNKPKDLNYLWRDWFGQKIPLNLRETIGIIEILQLCFYFLMKALSKRLFINLLHSN